MLIREYFPAQQFSWENPEAPLTETDKYNQRHSKISPLTATSDYNDSTILLTDEQERIKELMSDDFLKMCITQTFGIREGIMNLMSAIDFLVKAKVRNKTDELPQTLYIATGNDREEIDNADGSGIINLYFDAIIDGNGDRQPLTIMKKRDTEYKKDKKEADGKAESVLNLVSD
jgi:hypothetical protein